MYSCGPLHMAERKQGDQLKATYSSSVRIQGVTLRTCRKRGTIGRGSEKKSGISVPMAQHDDDVIVVAYFHPMRVTNPIRPRWLSRASNSVKARQTISSSKSFEQDGWFSVLVLIAAVSWHHEENRLIYGPWRLPSKTKVSIEHKLDVHISPLTFAMPTATRKYVQTFSYFIHPLLEIIILLSSTAIGLNTTGWTPNAYSSLFDCLLFYYDDQHKGFLYNKPLLNF